MREMRRKAGKLMNIVYFYVAFGCILFSAFSLPLANGFTTSPKQRKTNHFRRIGTLGDNRLTAKQLRPSRDSRSRSRLYMVQRLAMQPNANLAVSIDRPLLGQSQSGIGLFKSIVSFFLSEVFRTFAIGLAIALVAASLFRSEGALGIASNVLKMIKGKTLRLLDRAKPKKEGVPMQFSASNNGGWGVCTLRSKRRLGKTSMVQYDFDLPNPDHILPLKLGQQVSLCCLDEMSSVAKGDFYVYHPSITNKLGTFTIMAPNKALSENEYELGSESAHFVRVLKQTLKVGDEVAVKPGERNLEYKGKYSPVTDMVYICSGVGIVPVLEQVRAVLPNGSSSVKGVTVLWVDEDADEFDVISDQLEREYYKYNTKLAVSCVVDNLRSNTLADNGEIVNAIPDFSPGTMAVLSGPRAMTRKAATYLTSKRGYPDGCICEL